VNGYRHRLATKSNDPCDLDHTFEVFQFDVGHGSFGVDLGMPAPHREG
jgi:hypothetical protein